MLRRRGFTLVELMIVIAVIAVVAAIAIPNLLAARVRATETQAIGTLRAITTAQAQFRTSAKVDLDSDSTGQFGFLRELSGATGIRASADWSAAGATLAPSVLSGAFRALSPMGEAQRTGYYYHIFLPDAAGVGVPEPATSSLPSPPDETMSETFWCVYAYPAEYGRSGSRTFFANQAGIITTTDTSNYAGTGAFGAGTAGRALVGATGAALGVMTGQIAVGTRARDGELWTAIQ